MNLPVLALAAQSASEIDAALTTVFTRPEFDPPPRAPWWEWLLRALGDIVSFLRGLFPDFQLGEGSRSLIFWIVVGALVAAAVYLTVRLGLRLGRHRGRARGDSHTEPVAGPVSDTGPETAAEWERRAQELAAARRWREAALALYQSILRRLAARGALRIDPAKTPGDYREESRGDAESHRLLEGFLHGFEPLAFGGRVADEAAYERLVASAGLKVHRG